MGANTLTSPHSLLPGSQIGTWDAIRQEPGMENVICHENRSALDCEDYADSETQKPLLKFYFSFEYSTIEPSSNSFRIA